MNSKVSHARCNSQSLNSGFTLIEIMVAVFVLAIGILGVASMQAVGVREAQNTYFRTQADMLAKDIADKIRLNRAGAVSQSYASDGAAIVGDPCAAAGADCNGNQMANYDIAEWQTALTNSSLPGAIGTITVQVPVGLDASFSSYLIQIFWDENRNGSNGRGCNPQNPADMACVRMTVFI